MSWKWQEHIYFIHWIPQQVHQAEVSMYVVHVVEVDSLAERLQEHETN